MAATNLFKCQLGQEVTWGTAVAATAILMGFKEGSVTVEDEVYQGQQKGTLYPGSTDLVAQVKQAASGSFDQDLSYDDILYLLDGVFGDCTPSGTDPYTWAYEGPTTAIVAPREYTMEFGPTDAEYEIEGCIFNDFTISGDVDGDGIWQASVNFLGEAVAAGASTSLSVRVVELIRMADTLLTIDAVGGTIGTTSVPAALIAFELSVNPGHHLKTFAGSISPLSIGYNAWEGTLGLTLEYTADVKAFLDAIFTAKVEKQIQLEATSAPDSATIQFAGYLAGPPTLFDDRDGNVVIDMEWVGQYNTTLANWLKVDIINSIASLT